MMVWKNKKGAITVFLLIVFLSVLMLAGLIIDISRVMVAERKVQNALDTAARSVAAGYDDELVGQFGLYGISHTPEQEKELKRYFTVNLVDRHKNFHLINYQVQDLTVKYAVQKGLLNDDVFKNQIREYMKYKGPILMTQNVIEAFNLGGFGKKANLLDSGQKAQKSMEKIGQHKTSINNLAKNICAAAMEKIWDGATEKLTDLIKIENEIKLVQASIVCAQKELDENNKEIAEITNETAKCLKAEGKTMEERPKGLEGQQKLEELKKQLEQLKEAVNYSKEILVQIEPLEKEYRKLVANEKELESRKTLLKSILSNISEAQKVDLQNIEAELAKIADEKMELEEQICTLYNQLRPLPEVTFSVDACITDTLDDKNAKEKDNLLVKLKSIFDKQISVNNRSTLCITAEEFMAGNSGCVGEQPSDEEMANPEDKMKKLSKGTDNAEDVGSNVFSFISNLGKQIGEIAKSGVDKVYIIEYVMDKYTFVTSPIVRGHFFDKGEVEYILCGGNSQIDNLVGAFGRVWGLRFAINAVDAFFTSKIPSFWVRLGSALLQGFSQATIDMKEMYNGISVPICRSLKNLAVRLSYSDHLRLLLLIKSEKTILDRMRQLIQIDLRQIKPNFALKNYGTVITAKAEVSIDLWFASLLRLDKFGFKQIKGNKYCITKTAIVEY